VTQRWVVAHDENVVALTFAAADGKPLPRWFPGAHIDIHLPSGRLRQYSLCGNPEVTDSYRIAVRRIPDGGGGSIEVHDELAVGAAVTTGGPRNAFPLSISRYG
jgi:ferredoxin-NADP reductase